MGNVTGRDSYVIGVALATAIVTLEQARPDLKPLCYMDDMKRLLAEWHPATVTHLLAEAKGRFNPDLDRRELYRSYGIEVEDRRGGAARS